MSADGLVSVLTTVYNHAPYLAEALDSALAQQYSPVEIVVVDDGSDDGSDEVARGYGPAVRYVSQERRGTGASRNHALALARGEFIAFLDADDRLLPDAVALAMEAFEQAPEIEAVFGHVREFVSPDFDMGTRTRPRPVGTPVRGGGPSTGVIRAATFRRVGPFATHLRLGQDLDWSARASELGVRSVVLPEVVLERRLHAENSGRREREVVSDYVRAIKASLDRRRARGPQPGGA